MYWRSQVAAEAPAVRPAGKPKPRGKQLSKTPAKAAKAKYCGNCGSEIDKQHKFCSECGAEVA